MTGQKTHDGKGRPTAYGFACGFAETIGRARIDFRHGCYHVWQLGHVWSGKRLAEARRVARMWS